jgi:predicted enzyme related to lactoylglutathione lyase
MSDTPQQKIGHPVWFDLTLPDAEPVRDFYTRVLGWRSEAVDMGGYSDFVMQAPDGSGVAGVCNARGTNADMPPVWMVYFLVEDLEAAVEAVSSQGGRVLKAPSRAGAGRYAVIQDPAGAACALYQVEAEAADETETD